VSRTVSIMKDLGQAPVVAKKEVNGFIVNRLQYALIMEAWRLVEVRQAGCAAAVFYLWSSVFCRNLSH